MTALSFTIEDEVRSMIEQLDDLPEEVVGFKASGKLSATDYRDVVLPALESAFKERRGQVPN
jgi:hypothetical protein